MSLDNLLRPRSLALNLYFTVMTCGVLAVRVGSRPPPRFGLNPSTRADGSGASLIRVPSSALRTRNCHRSG
jgi:hypothetical protein